LSQPIVFTVSGGEVRSAKVSRDDPVWAVNFKKALALQLQTKLDSAANEIEVNRVIKNAKFKKEMYQNIKILKLYVEYIYVYIFY
jgi:hypothetical protein